MCPKPQYSQSLQLLSEKDRGTVSSNCKARQGQAQQGVSEQGLAAAGEEVS
jgi:hypothetical protein